MADSSSEKQIIEKGYDVFNFLKEALKAAGDIAARGNPTVKIIKLGIDGTNTVMGTYTVSLIKGNPDTSFDIVKGLGQMFANSAAGEGFVALVGPGTAAGTGVTVLGGGIAAAGGYAFGTGLQLIYDWSKNNPGLLNGFFDVIFAKPVPGAVGLDGLPYEGSSATVITNSDGSRTLIKTQDGVNSFVTRISNTGQSTSETGIDQALITGSYEVKSGDNLWNIAQGHVN